MLSAETFFLWRLFRREVVGNCPREYVTRQQPRGPQHHFGRNGSPARFEHALAHRGGADDAVAVFALRVLADEMGDSVEPFRVPGQDPGPHLVALVGFDFALERARDAAELDGEALLSHAEETVPVLVACGVDAGREEGAEEVGPRDVEVGIVGAVGFCCGFGSTVDRLGREEEVIIACVERVRLAYCAS